MPLSDRFTRSTSDACSSIDRFLWITPRPPCCAMAMASLDSVTVSMAALTSGTFRRMFRVRRVVTSTAVGTTSECRGTSRTSSKVSAVARPTSIEVACSVEASVFSAMRLLRQQVACAAGVRLRKSTPSSDFRRLTWHQPAWRSTHAAAPWHFLYFFPLPHGHGSFRPTFGSSRRTVFTSASSPPDARRLSVAPARRGSPGPARAWARRTARSARPPSPDRSG